MAFELPPLPYSRKALEPHISAETLDYHHGKHHKGYVDKLNAAIKDTKYQDMTLEEIIMSTGEGEVFNNAAQAWNHRFYWHCMSPTGGGQPPAELNDAMVRSFGSLDHFKDQFSEAVTSLFGSGWVWLVAGDDGGLEIQKLQNAGNPLDTEQRPLLTCDTWEHAFYIDYRNDKDRYLEAFWNVVDWRFAAGNLKDQQNKA